MLERSPIGNTRDKIPTCQESVAGVPLAFHSSLWNARGPFAMTYVLRPALSNGNIM